MAPPLPPLETDQQPLQDADPFGDDQLEAPPVPAAEAGYVAGKPVMIRRNNERPTARTSNEESPQKFQPVGAMPLKGLIPIPQSLFRDKAAPITDCQKCKAHTLTSAKRLRR